jgi:hypothetical protein
MKLWGRNVSPKSDIGPPRVEICLLGLKLSETLYLPLRSSKEKSVFTPVSVHPLGDNYIVNLRHFKGKVIFLQPKIGSFFGRRLWRIAKVDILN